MFLVELWLDGSGGLACTPPTNASTPLLDGIKDLTDILSSAVTTAAVVLGGGWAYFKFAKGRTFKPRLSVRLEGQWRQIKGSPVLYVRVWVSNVGATKFALKQKYSGLQVSFPDGGVKHQEVTWDPLRFEAEADEHDDASEVSVKSLPSREFIVFGEHEWFEPGETVYDDLLLNLNRDPGVVKLEVTLVGTARGKCRDSLDMKRDTEVFARTIIAPDP